MQIFQNTETAFRLKTNKELRKASALFRLMSYPLLVGLSGKLANVAIHLNIPLRWIVKPTIFSHFCGGETIEECRNVIDRLSKFKVESVLDFAAENQESDDQIESVMHEIKRTMKLANETSSVPFTVFKPTAIAPVRFLSAAAQYIPPSPDDNNKKYSAISFRESDKEKFRQNIRDLCQSAYEKRIPVMIDAEESYLQDIVDSLVMEMMELYNKEKAIVFNTLQMYRHDRLDFLRDCINIAKEKKYHLGLKLVRGAYMEQERERALKMGYPSPIYPDKQSTDKAFNLAIEICLENINRINLFAGTHNEESLLLLMNLMKSKKIRKNNTRVYVSQLYGMSDHISFNMAAHSFNVAKYLPYGPVRYLIPYLIRRAEENKSVTGQAGRELHFIKREIKRRKTSKNKKDGN